MFQICTHTKEETKHLSGWTKTIKRVWKKILDISNRLSILICVYVMWNLQYACKLKGFHERSSHCFIMSLYIIYIYVELFGQLWLIWLKYLYTFLHDFNHGWHWIKFRMSCFGYILKDLLFNGLIWAMSRKFNIYH